MRRLFCSVSQAVWVEDWESPSWRTKVSWRSRSSFQFFFFVCICLEGLHRSLEPKNDYSGREHTGPRLGSCLPECGPLQLFNGFISKSRLFRLFSRSLG